MNIRKHSGRHQGFSLIELMIVIGIIMLISAIAFPKIQGMMDTLKLRSTVTDVDGLVQQTRIQAVRDNKAYTLSTQAAGGANGTTLYIDNNGNGVLDAGEPSVQLPANTTVQGAGPGPVPPNAGGFTVSNPVSLNFNERGLPCTNLPTCRTITPFVVYFSQARAGGAVGWAAITVTQSGRIKAYTYTGGAAGTWQ